jgi:hypothetical protein
MKTKLSLFAILLSFFLASNCAFAAPQKPRPTKAPEISVDTAGSAIALLSGILLLVGERYRSRRS